MKYPRGIVFSLSQMNQMYFLLRSKADWRVDALSKLLPVLVGRAYYVARCGKRVQQRALNYDGCRFCNVICGVGVGYRDPFDGSGA
jgi:hypothetical protein